MQQRAAVVGVYPRDASSFPSQIVQQLSKSHPLGARKSNVVLDGRVVRVKALDLDSREFPRAVDQIARLVRRDAEASHARVHLDMRVHESVQVNGRPCKLSCFVQRGKGRPDAVHNRLLDFLRQAGAQHQHRPAFAHTVNGPRLGQVGHAEHVRTALHQHRRDLFQAVPIGVRLDHRHYLHHWPDAMAYPGEVLPQGLEVHFRPTPVAILHGDSRYLTASSLPPAGGLLTARESPPAAGL